MSLKNKALILWVFFIYNLINMNHKNYQKGKLIIISIDDYFKYGNKTKKLFNNQNQSPFYPEDKFISDKKMGKTYRSVIILWTHKWSRHLILLPITSSISDYNKKNNWEWKNNEENSPTGKSFIRLDPIICRKNDINLISKKNLSLKLNTIEINSLFSKWKNINSKKQSYNFITQKINEYELRTEIKKLEYHYNNKNK